uniref:TlpA family protein disulfide reductase n=1 Tax=Caldilinea aerophila TaxID=133453 RepID=A0A7C1K081_9CHLR
MGLRVASTSNLLSTKKVKAIRVVVGAVALTVALLWGIRSSAPVWVEPNVPPSSINLPTAAPPPITALPQGDPLQRQDASNIAIVPSSRNTVFQKDVAVPERANTVSHADIGSDVGNVADASAADQDIVAIVAGDVIALQDFQEASAIDTVMAGLAGVEAASAQVLVEQLIHTATVLRWGKVAVDFTQASIALEQFLQMHQLSRAELEAALLAQGVVWERFERYFARLVAADAYLRRQQAATGTASAALLRSWRQQTPISFGPAARAVLSAAAIPAPRPESEVRAETLPLAPVVEEPLGVPSEARGVEIGQLAPDFRLPMTPDFTWKTLQDFSGHPTVLSFWTTWCPYCLRQTPVMVDAHRRWESLGVQFVGINVRENSDPVDTYVTQHGITYPILLDVDGAVAAEYAIQGFPTTYFLDANLRIVARQVGALTSEQLDAYLRALRPAE